MAMDLKKRIYITDIFFDFYLINITGFINYYINTGLRILMIFNRLKF